MSPKLCNKQNLCRSSIAWQSRIQGCKTQWRFYSNFAASALEVSGGFEKFISGQGVRGLESSRVIPLLKKGDVNNMGNYRPITILPIASKLLERAVHTQLVNYLRKHKLLNPHQCSFRKGHSTKFAALSFVDTIRRNIDLGLMTGGVFLDLPKAFDSFDVAW